ncbi:hypothetical protein GCM10027079_20160 [Sediminivirga luteola]|uniref:Divalent-cation tolerance protein CutA n=2 Tax=Sediminivirga luteola TaxID=1774748 RepID=A0A8J2XJT8_9MICO|nr:hypothetical protein GCM10011333_09440 [Sediminivirga luteola]
MLVAAATGGSAAGAAPAGLDHALKGRQTGGMPSSRHVVAQTTVDSSELAERLATDAVERRLAACVQITPVTSVYRWKDGVQREAEFLLSLKTTASQVRGLRAFLEQEHPYDEPEFLVLPVIEGSDSYLRWIDESTGTS